MEILTKEQLNQLNLIKSLKLGSKFTTTGLTLEVGAGMIILKTEWTQKKAPYSLISDLHARSARQGTPKRFSCRTLADNTGWVIIRFS